MWRKILSVQNIYAALVYRILIIIFLYTVCRVLFLAFNYDHFSNIRFGEIMSVMVYGLRFDLSAIIITNAVFILLWLIPSPLREKTWYGKMSAWFFYIVNAVALLANCLDTVFFPFSFKRSTADIFGVVMVGGGDDFVRLLPRYLLDFWYILLIWSILVALMVLMYRKSGKKPQVRAKNVLYYLRHTAYFIGVAALAIVASRGGIQLRPISIISAGEVTSPRDIPLVLNTPFSIIQTIGKEQIELKPYYRSQKALDAVFNPYFKWVKPADSLKKLNVVIIILEGISSENFASLNPGLEDGKYKGYCPFLDSIASNGLVVTRAYSNGKKSIEGIPAVLASLPNLMDNPFITSRYAGDRMNGLPAILKDEGYTTAFFHGGTNGTMQFDAFSKVVGIDQYFGRSEYQNEADFDGNWGIFDEPFLQYTAKEINKLKQPFAVSIFTLSSHHPYLIPKAYQGKFPKGRLVITESIGYTDYALQKFFESISKTDWFNQTLFVITSDHSSLTFSPEYQTTAGRFAIPLIFYRPNGELTGKINRVSQQADILPSVLDYLGYSGDFISFGSSVFDSAAPHFSICYYNGIYQLIKGNIALEFNGEKTIAAFDMIKDPLMEHPLDMGDPDVRDAERFLKALIQSYNDRVIHNQLTTKR